MHKVAALFVQEKGTYAGQSGIDAWPESRDARLYAGDLPVVAHPPCARFCRLAGLVQARYPHLRKGEDGGCFASALASVRRWSGVLEHPAYSDAWPMFGLSRPNPKGGWSDPDAYGGRTCHVEQAHYGHRARKATWLYAVGTDLPELRWGRAPDVTAWVSYNQNHNAGKVVERLSKRASNATPPAFKAVLLDMARSVYRVRAMQTLGLS